jgi:hypothetical protein
VLVGGAAGGGFTGNICIKPPPEPVLVPGNTGNLSKHRLSNKIGVVGGQLPSEFGTVSFP